MAKKETSLQLASDAAVPEVMQLLDEKMKTLKKVEEAVYKTTGVLIEFGDLKTETKIETIIKAYSMISGKEEAYHRSAKDLGLSIYPAFNIEGGTTEQWLADLQLRIDVINYSDTLTKLKEYKHKVSLFLSAEDQKTILMREMAAFLGK